MKDKETLEKIVAALWSAPIVKPYTDSRSFIASAGQQHKHLGKVDWKNFGRVLFLTKVTYEDGTVEDFIHFDGDSRNLKNIEIAEKFESEITKLEGKFKQESEDKLRAWVKEFQGQPARFARETPWGSISIDFIDQAPVWESPSTVRAGSGLFPIDVFEKALEAAVRKVYDRINCSSTDEGHFDLRPVLETSIEPSIRESGAGAVVAKAVRLRINLPQKAAEIIAERRRQAGILTQR